MSRSPLEKSELDSTCVQAWLSRADTDPWEIDALAAFLSAEERERAARLHSVDDRREAIRSRGLLRRLLGDYLGRAPGEIRFEYGPQGKPRLAGAAGRRIRFNLAHSQGRVLIAVGRDREIGADLERVTGHEWPPGEAELVFSPAERAAISSLPRRRRSRRYLERWVCKEALLKALGTGLSMDPRRVELTTNGPDSRMVWTAEGAEWSVRLLSLGSGWVGAVAAEGRDWNLRLAEAPLSSFARLVESTGTGLAPATRSTG